MDENLQNMLMKFCSSICLKTAFISYSQYLGILFTIFLFFSHSVFIIKKKKLYKEQIDRPAQLSSDSPVNPRFAQPKDTSLLSQPKRQVGTRG